jgi:hypothetical protein
MAAGGFGRGWRLRWGFMPLRSRLVCCTTLLVLLLVLPLGNRGRHGLRTKFGPRQGTHTGEKQHHIQCQEQEFQQRALRASLLLFRLRSSIFSHNNPSLLEGKGRATHSAQPSAINSPLPTSV